MSDNPAPTIRLIAINLIYHGSGPPARPGTEFEVAEQEAEYLILRGAAFRVGDRPPAWMTNKQAVNRIDDEELARLKAAVPTPFGAELQPVPGPTPLARRVARFFTR